MPDIEMDSHTIPPEYGNSYGAVPHRAVPDLEEGNIFGVIDPFERTFQDRSYRMFFVRRVLALVGFQLFACTGAMALSLFYEPVNTFFKSNAGMSLGFVSFFLWIGLFIAIGCCRVGRGPPNPFNVTLLLVSTLLLSIYTANVVVKFEIPDIMIAAATTVGVVTLMALITFWTKFDITGYIMYVFGAVLAILLFSLIASFLFAFGVIPYEHQEIYKTIMSGIFAVIFAIMILYDLKMIVGDGSRGQYGVDDWLIASISLFYNILMFFLNMLNLTSRN